MDRVGDELLAGSTFSLDQHRHVARGDLFDFPEETAHDGALAQELAERGILAGPLAELAIFIDQPAPLERPRENHTQLRGIDRLLKEVESAERHGLEGVPPFSLPGHHDDRGVRLAPADFLQEVQTFLDFPGRGEPHVEEVDVGRRLTEVAPLAGIARGQHFELFLERPGQLLEQDRIVLDDQDPACGAHAAPPVGEETGVSAAAEDDRAEPGSFNRTTVPPPACDCTRIVPR